MIKYALLFLITLSATAGTVFNLEGKVLSYNDKFLTLQTNSKKVKVKNELLPAMIRTSPEKYLSKNVTIPLDPENYEKLK